MDTIGSRLKYAIVMRGITQVTLAERCEVSKNYISALVRDVRNPSLALVTRICDELSIRREWLLNGEEPMDKELTTPKPMSSEDLDKAFFSVITQLSDKQLLALKAIMEAFLEDNKAKEKAADD